SVYGENEKFDIQISIYSVTGTLVKRLFENTIESGYYEVEWDGKDSTGKPQTGLFIYSLEVESVNGVRSFKKKMIRQ
ncbi:MAG: FlgD immunoglobulin-like domain containing protein, partial [Bacteroidota bacterium]